MIELTILNSKFRELTQKCQQSHQAGISYFYEFEDLVVKEISKDGLIATVQGKIALVMEESEISYYGTFISTCCRKSKGAEWKLDEIEIDWD